MVAVIAAAVVITAGVDAIAVVITLVFVVTGPGVREKLAGVFKPSENPVLVMVAVAEVEAMGVAVVTDKVVLVGLNPNGAEVVEVAGVGTVLLFNVKPVVTEVAGGTELTTEANRVGTAAGALVKAPAAFVPKEKP